MFEIFKAGWGSCVNTTWEKELSHIVTVLGYALEAQATLRVMTDNAGFYQGSVILGGNFSITFGEVKHSAASRRDLVADYNKSSPHLNALSNIFRCIMFADGAARSAALAQCSSIHTLRNLIATNGTTEALGHQIKERAPFLSFPADPTFLAVTSKNICTIIDAIANPNFDEWRVPLHYSCLCDTNRTIRLLSAFGSTAPSFMCPGGKVMSLENEMETLRKGKNGKPEAVNVAKMAVIMKPLAAAVIDWESMITSKTIQNPFANAVVSRISSGSLLRTYEKESATQLVASLRKAMNINLVRAGASGKRKADDDADKIAAKKSKLFDL